MADKGAPLVDSSKEDQQVLADHAGMSPAESYVKLTCSPSEVAGMGVFVVLLSYASGLPLLIVSVLQQCDWLPSLDNTLFWTILFPIQMGQFKQDTDASAVGIDLNAPNYLILALPFFILSLAWEWIMLFYVVENAPKHLPRMNDTLISLSLGILNQIVTVLIFLAWAKPLYKLIHSHLGITDPAGDSTVAWWCSLVMFDFFYYWWHRSSHYLSWLWTDHVVHHSSEEYNLATALRQPFNAFATPDQLISLMPLAFFFPWPLAAMHGSLSLLYQYWIHTSLIPPLPKFELIFNSPSLHRIHHVRNSHQLGKNYGAIFSIWDRMFGTLCEEPRDGQPGIVEPSYYGVIPPLHSFNPLWANIHHWHYMITVQYKWHGIRGLLMHWTPPDATCPKLGQKMNPCTKYDPQLRRQHSLWIPYAVVQFVAALGFTVIGNLAFDELAQGTREVLGLSRHYPGKLVAGFVLFSVTLWTLCTVGSALEVNTRTCSQLIKYEWLRHAVVLFVASSFAVHYKTRLLLCSAGLVFYAVSQGGLLAVLSWQASRAEVMCDVVHVAPEEDDNTVHESKAWGSWYQPNFKVGHAECNPMRRVSQSSSGLDQA